MHVIYHTLYEEIHESDPAAEPGRMECIVKELEGRYGHSVLGIHIRSFLEGMH